MFWEENNTAAKNLESNDMVDVTFAIKCKTLPVDHAHELAKAVVAILPWLETEAGAGVHTIHVAESSNGWQRPQDILYPSRRTRLMLRIPGDRLADTLVLSGQQLQIGGHQLDINQHMDTRPMSGLTTLFTRYLICNDHMDEEDFLTDVSIQLKNMGIKARKMLCGREQVLAKGGQTIKSRSLMIADLEPEEAIKLQKQGLGSHRYMGCGLFIPHKSIKEVSN